uniref:RluA family pseudouridine synthase n=1 Tax=Prevotella sp. GTC17253 TaxID=3236793 RepID=A0AB33IUS5_9BACT
MVFHRLTDSTERPLRFNNPFYYQPHPLCLTAAGQLMARLAATASTPFGQEIAAGKMFGVLIVALENGEMGYLQAYSGQICGRSDWDDYVPAVFDYLQPDGYFKTHEQQISAINDEIVQLESSTSYRQRQQDLASIRAEGQTAITAQRCLMEQSKRRRDALRQSGQNFDETALIRESQFQKAELRRIKQYFAQKEQHICDEIGDFENRIQTLKTQRHQMSDALQIWLFSHFSLLNAHGETRDLLDIFAPTAAGIPPSGSGECCEPRLLQYAYQHRMRPLQMAMFWWGASPKQELRRHGRFYPACNGKCKPILEWMLQGLDVETNPLDADTHDELRTIDEGEHYVVVDKPAGMLSVPGKSKRESAASILRARYPEADGPMMVHRLDMATSGLLIAALDMPTYVYLQRLFATHRIQKRYVALLDGEAEGPTDGTIELPLAPDIMDRPRQKVDREHGRWAVTRYHIIERKDGKTRIALFPETGRTHQLRVHCAHPDGLNCPIVGDELYGKRADRMYLHAEEIKIAPDEAYPWDAMKWVCEADF